MSVVHWIRFHIPTFGGLGRNLDHHDGIGGDLNYAKTTDTGSFAIYSSTDRISHLSQSIGCFQIFPSGVETAKIVFKRCMPVSVKIQIYLSHQLFSGTYSDGIYRNLTSTTA